jgi:hypothetical protein
MLVMVVRHHINPGQFDQAHSRIVGNTDAMAGMAGFVFRHTATLPNSKDEIVTITAWRSAKDKAAWDEKRKLTPPPGDPKVLYSKVDTLETETTDDRWMPAMAAALKSQR